MRSWNGSGTCSEEYVGTDMERKKLIQFLYNLWDGYMAFSGLDRDRHEPNVWGDILAYMWQQGAPESNALDFIEGFHTWMYKKPENRAAMEKFYQALYRIRLRIS